MRSFTSSSRTLQRLPLPSLTAALALVWFLGARTFFLLFPDAFVAYPESATEFQFYLHDQRCAMNKPEPQIVIQGTSRLLPVNFIMIGGENWHTRDKVLNLSSPGNTFWHMAALLRRHPHLLEHTELQVIDLIPFQLMVGKPF